MKRIKSDWFCDYCATFETCDHTYPEGGCTHFQGIEVIIPEEDEEDPTPYCAGCGAPTKKQCKCGPLADNY